MSSFDTVPGPAFDPDDLEAALGHAAYLEMAVFLCDGLDTADEVLLVGPFHCKAGTALELWADRFGGDGIEWFVQRHLGTGRVEVAENGGDGALAYFGTPSEALDYIARTRLLRAPLRNSKPCKT